VRVLCAATHDDKGLQMGMERRFVVRAFGAGLVGVIAAMQAWAPAPVAASSNPADCPDLTILDQAEVEALAPGTALVGLTVEQGDTPTEIDFVVEHVQLGALQDSAPLVIVRATSGSPVTEGKGIWFGMSGSPVFTVDGLGDPEALVGAVAFGLAADGSSPIGGLQPAYQMEKVRRYPSTGASVTTVALGEQGARRVAAATGLTTTAARKFQPLAVPLALSTGSGGRIDLVRRAAEHAGVPIVPVGTGSATSSAATLTTASLAAGDTFVAALSYGRLSAAGVGTTTYVCGDHAMAFGHPFLHAGRQAFGANAATDAYVVADPLMGSYKLARVGGLAGRVDQDRAAGLRAALGASVPLVPVHSKVRAPDVRQSSEEHTDVVVSSELPWLSTLHSLVHMDDVADHVSDGSSSVRWTITGTTPGGGPWQLERGNRYTSTDDIVFRSALDLFEDLTQLQENRFAPVTFTGVDVKAAVREDVLRYRVDRVRVRQGDRYRNLDRIVVEPGERVHLEIRLARGDGTTRLVHRAITVPRTALGTGRITVRGAGGGGGFGFGFIGVDIADMLDECMFGSCASAATGPKNFKQLLASMADQRRNDVLVTELRLANFDLRTGRGTMVQKSNERRLDRVVRGSARIRVLAIPPVL
jgi:hypothetical protein